MPGGFRQKQPVKTEKMEQLHINQGMSKNSSSPDYWTGLGERSLDKIVRPVVTGLIGLSYYTYMYGFEMSYSMQKFGILAASAVVADYVGNFVVDSSALKSMGLRRVENMVIEPILCGLTLASLNKYVMGINGKFTNDLLIGGGTDLASGIVMAPIMRMLF